MKCETKSFVSALTIICVSLINLACAESVIKQPDIKVQQVALFKNGLGFFISQVTCPQDQSSFVITPEAVPSHGTFWIAYPPKVKLEHLVAKEVTTEKPKQAVSVEELLKANIGRQVWLTFDDKGESAVKGKISYFAEDRQIPRPDPYAPGAIQNDNSRNVPSYERASLMMVLTDAGQTAINPHTVRMVKFTDNNDTNKTFNSKCKSVQFEIKMDSPAAGENLTLGYLAKGITWAPSYMVDITGSDKAVISAKAVVINEICDLNNVTVQLVTGFPHLQFADIVSPLAMKENLAQFLESLTRGQSERGRAGVTSNVMMQRSESEEFNEEYITALSSGPVYEAARAGTTAEDLFLYPLEKVSIAKGQVCYFPLFTESVPYKHIYQWKIPDYINEEGRYFNRQRRPENEPIEEVWHCLRMENITKVPWTTAPAEIIKDGFILGQDTLNYTPSQDKTTLKITQAVNVKAEQLELETERKRDAAQFYGDHYDLITITGKLSVTNYQNKAITLEIEKILSGEVKSSEPQAKLESLARGISRVNAIKKLIWTIELAQGESRQINYVYEVYVRR